MKQQHNFVKCNSVLCNKLCDTDFIISTSSKRNENKKQSVVTCPQCFFSNNNQLNTCSSGLVRCSSVSCNKICDTDFILSHYPKREKKQSVISCPHCFHMNLQLNKKGGMNSMESSLLSTNTPDVHHTTSENDVNYQYHTSQPISCHSQAHMKESNKYYNEMPVGINCDYHGVNNLPCLTQTEQGLNQLVHQQQIHYRQQEQEEYIHQQQAATGKQSWFFN